jgi:hypothetical protein
MQTPELHHVLEWEERVGNVRPRYVIQSFHDTSQPRVDRVLNFREQ